MKKRRKIILISGAVLIAIMLINIGQYAITRWYPINIDWETGKRPCQCGRDYLRTITSATGKENGITRYSFYDGLQSYFAVH